jgi:hypothetical protein
MLKPTLSHYITGACHPVQQSRKQTRGRPQRWGIRTTTNRTPWPPTSKATYLNVEGDRVLLRDGYVSGIDRVLRLWFYDPDTTCCEGASHFSSRSDLAGKCVLARPVRHSPPFRGYVRYVSRLHRWMPMAVHMGHHRGLCAERPYAGVLPRTQARGPAACLPASLTLLESIYRPGPRKNFVFGVYGARAPLGFFLGIFFAGLAGQYADWGWYFWIGAILTALTTIIAWWTIRSDFERREDTSVEMGWHGSLTTVLGLILMVFSVNDVSHAPDGWATPCILFTLILRVLSLGMAFYVEGWVAKQPLLPFEVFKFKYIRAFVVGLLFTYGTDGTYLVYVTL